MTWIETMTRGEYVAWCKQRALAEQNTDGPHLGFLMLAGANHTNDPDAMRRFIEGFN